jgi:hypothetical protein
MTRNPSGRRLAFDALESRLALSSAVPANTLAVVQGQIPSPGAVVHVSTPIAPANLTPGRAGTVIGVVVSPQSAGAAQPTIVSATAPDGTRLVLRPEGHSRLSGDQGGAVYFVTDSMAGPLTFDVTNPRGGTGSFRLRTYLPGDVNGDGTVTLADLQALAPSYLARQGQPRYNPAADAYLSGQINQWDARILGQNLSPLTTPVPLFLNLSLAPGEQVEHSGTFNSGAETHLSDVTVIGRTIPGSLVFADGPNGLYKFNGPLLPTNAAGVFTEHVHLKGPLNANVNFLVVDPFGRQLVKNFPIRKV